MVRTWDCSSNKDHWEKKQIIMLLSYLESCSVVVDESEAVTAPREKINIMHDDIMRSQLLIILL